MKKLLFILVLFFALVNCPAKKNEQQTPQKQNAAGSLSKQKDSGTFETMVLIGAVFVLIVTLWSPELHRSKWHKKTGRSG